MLMQTETNVADLVLGLRQMGGSVVVVGSINSDLTTRVSEFPLPGETVLGESDSLQPGGKSANQAVAASRLGTGCQIVGLVGRDANGDMLIDALRHAGVGTSGIKRAESPSGFANILVNGSGDNVIIVSPGANRSVDGTYVSSQADSIAHSSVMGLCFEIPMDGVLSAARLGSNGGMTVVLNPSPYVAVPTELLSLVDIMILNEVELLQFADQIGICGPEECDLTAEAVVSRILRDAPSQIPGWLVVTLGGSGSVIVSKGMDNSYSTRRVAAVNVRVVDTTGCGDAFMGSLLACLASGLSVNEGVQVATYYASQAATSAGAQTSYLEREELLSRLNLKAGPD